MFKNKNSIEFAKRKYKLIITSIDILKISYNMGSIALINYFNDNSKLTDIVYCYYAEALELIINGRPPEQVVFMLEYEKMKWIRKSNITEEDLLLITIIQGVVPYLQKLDFDGFYDLCRNLFSGKEGGEFANLLLEINPHMWDKYQ